MNRRNQWIAVLVAAAGIGLCLAALVGFLATIRDNNLPWHTSETPRDFYLAVGDSYTQGFTVGFFLCFFLIMIAVCVGRWLDHRRAAAVTVKHPGDPAVCESRR